MASGFGERGGNWGDFGKSTGKVVMHREDRKSIRWVGGEAVWKGGGEQPIKLRERRGKNFFQMGFGGGVTRAPDLSVKKGLKRGINVDAKGIKRILERNLYRKAGRWRKGKGAIFLRAG